MDEIEIQNIEIDLLLDAIFKTYGYDFRNYSKASITRRVMKRVKEENFTRITQLMDQIIHNRLCFERLRSDFSISTTEFFRDAQFYTDLREVVLPKLSTYPFIKIWHAGCSTGEEVYSVSILLHELNLLDRCQIYATDISSQHLNIAKSGIYPLDKLVELKSSYAHCGGSKNLDEYYTSRYDSFIFSHIFRKNIVFAKHNLVSDTVFCDANLILCRNVMIYFNQTLKENVINLFSESLVRNGLLAVGNRESLDFLGEKNKFESVNGAAKVYELKSDH